jgi:CHASE2 domain
MTRPAIILFTTLIFFGQCRNKYSVELTNLIDPEIVLINIGEGDRAFLGDLLLSINSCKPALIAIDAIFKGEKGRIQDSVLMNALKVVQNDILIYFVDSANKLESSHIKFRSLATDEGFSNVEKPDGLSSHIIPIRVVDNNTYEAIALKIIKRWKPGFKHTIKANQSIPIDFTRTLNQYFLFEGSDIISNDQLVDLKNKIILLGYLGPTNEDKHFTPIRFVKEYPDNEPDIYGLVLIANEIRTILNYEIPAVNKE